MIMVAGEAFLLRENLMRPHLYRELQCKQKIFSHRLSNDGIIIEGAVHPFVTFLHGVVHS
jgi:hypothetical protein